jgi:hypothetical protein
MALTANEAFFLKLQKRFAHRSLAALEMRREFEFRQPGSGRQVP